MDMHDILVEAAKEALEEIGETLSDEGIGNIVCWIEGCYENRELLSAPVENPLVYEIEEIKRKHKREIEERERVEDIFKDSVRKRRNCQHVWIENGSVCYE